MKILLKTLLLGVILSNTSLLLANDQSIKIVSNANYLSKLLKSDKPTVVKFWASWCRACSVMAPEFDKASKALKGKVNFASVDVDAQIETASSYQIHSLPTLILFQKNKIIKKEIGSLSQAEIEAFIKNNI